MRLSKIFIYQEKIAVLMALHYDYDKKFNYFTHIISDVPQLFKSFVLDFFKVCRSVIPR